MRFLINLIIEIGLKNEKAFLRELARLEYGVSIFCHKLVVKARTQRHFDLADKLLEHGNQELKHGKMLAALCDGKQKVTLDTVTGGWIEMSLAGNDFLIPPRPTLETKLKTLVWNSVKFPGQKIIAKHQNFDGMSQRYFSVRLLFCGKKAHEFDWEDKLAFMCALERGTQQFYEYLSKHPKVSPPLKAIALQIANDEAEHSEYLRYCLGHFTHFPLQTIDKWECRVKVASLGLFVDIWRIAFDR